MRIICFKGKRIDTGEWVTGSFFKSYNGRCYIMALFDTETTSGEFFEVEKDSICQCTGETDAKRELIWENDIIKHPYGDNRGVVRFGVYHSELDTRKTYHCGFYVEWANKDLYRKDLGFYLQLGAMVIGNCIDNPEMVEEGAA